MEVKENECDVYDCNGDGTFCFKAINPAGVEWPLGCVCEEHAPILDLLEDRCIKPNAKTKKMLNATLGTFDAKLVCRCTENLCNDVQSVHTTANSVNSSSVKVSTLFPAITRITPLTWNSSSSSGKLSTLFQTAITVFTMAVIFAQI